VLVCFKTFCANLTLFLNASNEIKKQLNLEIYTKKQTFNKLGFQT
jgi:hypothetical protein